MMTQGQLARGDNGSSAVVATETRFRTCFAIPLLTVNPNNVSHRRLPDDNDLP